LLERLRFGIQLRFLKSKGTVTIVKIDALLEVPVNDVFSANVPVGQWLLSLPTNIQYRSAYDGKLLSDVLSVFLRVVRGWRSLQ
jgi:hypothetical protein